MDTGSYWQVMRFGEGGWGALMATAACVTIAVAACGYLAGLVIGTCVCWMRLSRRASLRVFADAYTTLLRGIPDLLVIYLFYFGGSSALTHIAGLFQQKGFVSVPAFVTGALAIGVVSAAYQAQVLRGAYLAIDRGQIEAGHAYGMTYAKVLRRVIVPQMLPFALPGLGNIWQQALKESALISVTGLVELMRQSAVGTGSTQQPFYFYATAAALYLLITSMSGWGLKRLEAHAFRGVRSA